MSFRDFLSATTRGVPRAIAALLAQKGTARDNGLLANAGLAISATAAKFKTTRTAIFSISNVVTTKAATDALVFTAAHTITATLFGAIRVQISAAGAVSTKVVASPQAYTTAALALAAVPAADAGKQSLGVIVVHAGVADWVGNTDVLTGATVLDERELGSES